MPVVVTSTPPSREWKPSSCYEPMQAKSTSRQSISCADTVCAHEC